MVDVVNGMFIVQGEQGIVYVVVLQGGVQCVVVEYYDVGFDDFGFNVGLLDVWYLQGDVMFECIDVGVVKNEFWGDNIVVFGVFVFLIFQMVIGFMLGQWYVFLVQVQIDLIVMCDVIVVVDIGVGVVD